MKRIKIFKVYFVLWLFVYFIAISNLESFKLYFMSTLTFNIAIVTLLAIGTIMLLRGAKDLVMIAGTFGVLMYKKRNLSFYIRGIEKVLPTNIAAKISKRADQNMLLFTQQEKEEILSWIDEQFANQNKYNNFFIGTVLMIGLLGTFSGLLGAIGNMGSIVMSLSGSNIDIGKIMASFSGPLSSMAVGFGSSLFGVISAILLSIKGYLLNRSQAAVLDGVENWLNARTVETLEPATEASVEKHHLAAKTPNFLDIFVEQTGALHRQIEVLNHNNKEMKEAFAASMNLIQHMQKVQVKTLQGVMQALGTLHEEQRNGHLQTERYFSESQKLQQTQQQMFQELISLQKMQHSDMVDLHTELEDATYIMQKERAENLKIQQKISEQLQDVRYKTGEDSKIEQFQFLEMMEKMQQNLVREIRQQKGAGSTQKEHNVTQKTQQSFLQKHFSRTFSDSKEKAE